MRYYLQNKSKGAATRPLTDNKRKVIIESSIIQLGIFIRLPDPALDLRVKVID